MRVCGYLPLDKLDIRVDSAHTMNDQLDTSSAFGALIGSTEAALILGWSRSKVKQDAHAGRLAFEQKLPGKTGGYLFHRGTIEALAAQQVAA